MINFEEFACLDGINIYKKLANSWRVTAIDRQPTWREVTLIPIYDGYAPMGASILIAIMAYPNDIAKQEAYIKAVAAWTIKRSAPPRSTKRAQLRKYPEYD